MEIKTISVTYQRKFNLGDYESLEIGCSLWGQIDPEEDPEGATQFLYQQAKTAVKEAAKPVLKESNHQMNKARIYKQSTQNTITDEQEDF
ncbi:hypothetical protein A6770_33010 [Nostoc minutum NIES-26]|uniref:Uncharacterized protein n=1 Tax=Nostoc minutum NIES-26 TaxID=1844469 RepID=A0A367Q2S0_9NOSO|nr:hypothetical protein A6770_33010 [Nostoc minutum NIES-26]